MSTRVKFEPKKSFGDRVAQALTIQQLKRKQEKPDPKPWHEHVMEDTPPVPPKPKKGSHIRTAPNMGTFFCLHCGESYTPALPISITMLVACMKAFKKDHLRCRKTEKGLACGWCLNFGHEPNACPRLDYKGDPQRWLDGPDTGLSSETIWKWMQYKSVSRPSVPHDPDDFGRCYRLLKAFPDWRKRMWEMAEVNGWEQLAPAWAELETLYEEEVASGRCPKLAERMRELGL